MFGQFFIEFAPLRLSLILPFNDGTNNHLHFPLVTS